MRHLPPPRRSAFDHAVALLNPHEAKSALGGLARGSAAIGLGGAAFLALTSVKDVVEGGLPLAAARLASNATVIGGATGVLEFLWLLMGSAMNFSDLKDGT